MFEGAIMSGLRRRYGKKWSEDKEEVPTRITGKIQFDKNGNVYIIEDTEE